MDLGLWWAMDCRPLLGSTGETVMIFDNNQLTCLLLDKPASRCKTSHILCLCRQDKAFLLWYPEGLSSDCTVYKPSCWIMEWEWYWRGTHCWMATNCRLTFVFPTILVLTIYGLGWGRSTGIWEEGLCELQTSCLAWLILWAIGLNSCPLKNWFPH